MFKDILGPDKPDDSQNYDEEGFYKDDKAKESAMGSDHSSDCQCDSCLEEAIKELCDQMGIDLDGEELEDIKIEYYNKDDDEDLNPFSLSGKLCIAMARKFHRDVMNDIRDMNWKKYKKE